MRTQRYKILCDNQKGSAVLSSFPLHPSALPDANCNANPRFGRSSGSPKVSLRASGIQLSESDSNLAELRKSCCHLHITPCHLYVLRRMLTACLRVTYMYFVVGLHKKSVPGNPDTLIIKRRDGDDLSISAGYTS